MKYLFRFSGAAGLAITLLAGVLGPAQAAPPLSAADIYNPLKIVRADLTLPQSSVDSLDSLDKSQLVIYVPGTLSMSLDGRTSGNLDIKVRLKGSTSLYRLSETPSFKVKFKNSSLPNGYQGLKRLTFNAMVQDSSKIHEYGAYSLFNAVGVPASRTGWVRLYINGVDRGLYVNVEQPDNSFMGRKFKDITQHIYEGVYNKDFQLGNDYGDDKTGAFLVDYGWKATPNKRDLAKAINYQADWENKTWYPGLNAVFDRTEMIKFFATEVFLGHWDGYTGPNISNYYVRSNTKSKFSFIPWGVDQTFGEERHSEVLGDTFNTPFLSDTMPHPWSGGHYGNRGAIYVKCINYKPCRTEFLNDLKLVSLTATKIQLATKMRAATKLIEPVIANQFSSAPATLKLIDNEQNRTISWIALRQKAVTALLKKYGIK
ncbi:MAG: hypothetical protein EBT82_03595 [Micrococcales bacterium]|nr:hypothetical protein [Micrococcales bacterium]NBR55042.1 hypothetical protein [Micrococcales bacterium]NBR61321.1 hypothetical protein [Actinomycetota bacterium]NBT47434.1 hypothetical protein [Actinomycetota bacterium]NBY43370.1 hypothetical protein [Micrococcales bacterium]